MLAKGSQTLGLSDIICEKEQTSLQKKSRLPDQHSHEKSWTAKPMKFNKNFETVLEGPFTTPERTVTSFSSLAGY